MRKINVFIKPGSKEQKIEINDNLYTVFVRSKPKDGEANKELKEVLAKYFNISKSKVLIQSGYKSRYKVISIHT